MIRLLFQVSIIAGTTSNSQAKEDIAGLKASELLLLHNNLRRLYVMTQ